MLIAYEVTKQKIGVLPSLAPHLTATKIRALYTYLREQLCKILSIQSTDFGYQGMVNAPAVYALTGAPTWQDFNNPGYHWSVDGTLSVLEQQDDNVIFNFATIVYNSQKNLKAAINNRLKASVPEAYPGNSIAMGVREYCPTDNPREIIQQLTVQYGQQTPNEVT